MRTKQLLMFSIYFFVFTLFYQSAHAQSENKKQYRENHIIIKFKSTDDCMDCFVRHGVITKMTPRDSDIGIDIFECPKCWDRKEVDYKSG